MMGCTKQYKQQFASVLLRLLLVAAALLVTGNDVIAQDIRVTVIPQQSNESSNALSGLPTLAEISATKVDKAVEQIVAQLDSSSFEMRELASQRLVSNSFDRRQICKVLSGNNLSLEQRHRLVSWLKHDLISTPHAAIGISIDTAKNDGAINVVALIESLPAIEVLLPGDQIISLDGLPVVERNQFLQSIGSRKPGDKVTVRVKRRVVRDDRNDDQKLEVREMNFEIVLGSNKVLLDLDGTGRGNVVVQNALDSDLKAIARRYGPKILRIDGDVSSGLNFGTTAVKKK